MDFERRIQEAQQYVDQTKGSWDAAKKETGIAQADYDQSFSTAPDYQTLLEQSKLKNEELYEVSYAKSQWEQTKAQLDGIKSDIDNLPQSVVGSFKSSGMMMTEEKYRKALQLQNRSLANQFKQYDANYKVAFTDYNKAVDKALSGSIDVANKNYDSYWDGVRMKMSQWQQSIANEDEWSSMYYGAQSQLSSVQSEYQIWQIQQETIRMQRESEEWQNNFAAQQRASRSSAAMAAQQYSEQQAKKKADADARFKKDTALFQQGRLSSSEYLRRMDAGQYRS